MLGRTRKNDFLSFGIWLRKNVGSKCAKRLIMTDMRKKKVQRPVTKKKIGKQYTASMNWDSIKFEMAIMHESGH